MKRWHARLRGLPGPETWPPPPRWSAVSGSRGPCAQTRPVQHLHLQAKLKIGYRAREVRALAMPRSGLPGLAPGTGLGRASRLRAVWGGGPGGPVLTGSPARAAPGRTSAQPDIARVHSVQPSHFTLASAGQHWDRLCFAARPAPRLITSQPPPPRDDVGGLWPTAAHRGRAHDGAGCEDPECHCRHGRSQHPQIQPGTRGAGQGAPEGRVGQGRAGCVGLGEPAKLADRALQDGVAMGREVCVCPCHADAGGRHRGRDHLQRRRHHPEPAGSGAPCRQGAPRHAACAAGACVARGVRAACRGSLACTGTTAQEGGGGSACGRTGPRPEAALPPCSVGTVPLDPPRP